MGLEGLMKMRNEESRLFPTNITNVFWGFLFDWQLKSRDNNDNFAGTEKGKRPTAKWDAQSNRTEKIEQFAVYSFCNYHYKSKPILRQ